MVALSLIFLFAIYVTKVIVRSVRRVARTADDRDEGDVEVRTPETSPAEIGVLESEYKTMVASLAASRDELRQVADIQDTLRHVATLVACGVSASEIFAAVAAEVGTRSKRITP